MTPEREAAAAVAAALLAMTVRKRVPPLMQSVEITFTDDAAQRFGTFAMEAIAEAGLVIVTAGRIAELLDANNRERERRRAALRALRLCLPHMLAAVESTVQCHSTDYAWESGQPLPADCEPDALLMAADAEKAIAEAKAALGETADA